MTRREAADLYGWLKDTYPRNYRDADDRRDATTIDNLARAFSENTFTEVIAEYQRAFTRQKTEPHPSDIRAAIRHEGRRGVPAAAEERDPYEILKQHRKWPEFCQAYGERACRRAAKLCTQTAGINELTFRLQHDLPCREGSFLWMLEGPLPDFLK